MQGWQKPHYEYEQWIDLRGDKTEPTYLYEDLNDSRQYLELLLNSNCWYKI